MDMGLVLAVGICYGVMCILTGIVFLSCLVYGGIVLVVLSLLQWVIGQVVEGITGDRPDWLFSKSSFALETLLIVALAVGYANIPLHPARMDTGAVSLVYDTAAAGPGNGEARLSYQENIDRLVEKLNGIKASHVFITGKETLEKAANKKAWKFYFYDSDGNFVKKIALDPGLIGVSSRPDGNYVWYDLKEEDRTALERLVWDLDDAEQLCRTEEDNEEAFEALCVSFRYEDGTYWFTLPEFRAEEWNVEITAFERKFTQTVIKSSGYVMWTGDETGTGHFLTEETQERTWQAGQTYSFQLEDKTYESVSCTVTLDGSEFQFDFPAPEGKYLANREEPVTYYIVS